LLEWFNDWNKVLLKGEDEKTIYRAQGALKILQSIIEMPASIRTFLHEQELERKKGGQ